MVATATVVVVVFVEATRLGDLEGGAGRTRAVEDARDGETVVERRVCAVAAVAAAAAAVIDLLRAAAPDAGDRGALGLTLLGRPLGRGALSALGGLVGFRHAARLLLLLLLLFTVPAAVADGGGTAAPALPLQRIDAELSMGGGWNIFQ